jgi:hypothetical protein
MKGIQLTCIYESLAICEVIDRFFAGPVACQEKFPALVIVNGQCKHAIHILKAIRTQFGVKMEDRFGIGMCLAGGKLVCLSEFKVIIDLSIKDEREMLELHGLFSTCNIQDGKPVMMQLAVTFHHGGLFVGPPVPQILCQPGNIEVVIN